MIRNNALFLLPLLLTACDPQESSSNPDSDLREIVEVLEHDEGSFTEGQTIPVGEVGASFTVDDITFTITNRWPHAEAARRVTDDAEDEFHAVEVAWDVEDGEQLQWIFQTGSDGALETIEALGAKLGVTPAGARPLVADDSSFKGQVQFQWNQRLYDLPPMGGEVFEGWTLKDLKIYQHALMDEEGGVTETEDGGFTNRVLEVFLTDGKGSEERHITFLDHPELTTGIHPKILPVARISGEATSLSRLVVCRKLEPSVDHQVVQLTPAVDGPGITARIWPKGSAEFKTVTVPQLPAELPLEEGGVLRLKRHHAHARPHLKTERFDQPAEGDAKPALIIEHRLSHHQKSEFVLIRGEVTPCRIGDKHLMLRFAVGQ